MKEVAEGKKDYERKEGRKEGRKKTWRERVRDGEKRRRKEEERGMKGRKNGSNAEEEMNKLR
jgi:hypothetical protein